MISLNLSPETKVGRITNTPEGKVEIQHVSGKVYELTKEKFKQFAKQEQLSLTKAGFLFTQKKKGIIPEFLDFHYQERVKIQKDLFNKMVEEKSIEDELKEIERQLQEVK